MQKKLVSVVVVSAGLAFAAFGGDVMQVDGYLVSRREDSKSVTFDVGRARKENGWHSLSESDGDYFLRLKDFPTNESLVVTLASNLLPKARCDGRKADVLFMADEFVMDGVLQRELHAVLHRKHPREFAAALKSSGNMHNPKLEFLYGALLPALRETPSAKKLSRLAVEAGYSPEVEFLGGEKIHFVREDWRTDEKFADPEPRIFSVFGVRFKPATKADGGR